eukprot:COSAG01_NODE_20613_length_945_cov_0.986998_1_plen_115_part_10
MQVLAADLAQRAGKAGDANWTSRVQGAIMVSFMNYKELRQGYAVRASTKRPNAPNAPRSQLTAHLNDAPCPPLPAIARHSPATAPQSDSRIEAPCLVNGGHGASLRHHNQPRRLS